MVMLLEGAARWPRLARMANQVANRAIRWLKSTELQDKREPWPKRNESCEIQIPYTVYKMSNALFMNTSIY
tara:strand:+ start:362 stop:574 length:213 start_codon:yes stop_codon:yes gene_type:complete